MAWSDVLSRSLGHLVQRPPFAAKTSKLLHTQRNVLFYHGIWSDASPARRLFWGLSVSRFREDLKQLSEWFTFAPLSDVLSGDPLDSPRPKLAITFDDGCTMMQSNCVEILAEHSIAATAFVVTDCLDNQRLMWRHKLNCIEVFRGPLVLKRAMRSVEPELRASRPSSQSNTFSGDPFLRWPPYQKDILADRLWKQIGRAHV